MKMAALHEPLRFFLLLLLLFRGFTVIFAAAPLADQDATPAAPTLLPPRPQPSPPTPPSTPPGPPSPLPVPPLAPPSPPSSTPPPVPPPPPPASPSVPSPPPQNEAKGPQKGVSGGQKAGIAIGVLAAAGAAGFGGMVYKKRRDNIRRARFGHSARRPHL